MQLKTRLILVIAFVFGMLAIGGILLNMGMKINEDRQEQLAPYEELLNDY